MSGLTSAGADMVVTWMFTDATAPSRPGAWFVALHTEDPTETGDVGEVLVAHDADYTRKAVTFADPVTGSGMCLSEVQVSHTPDASASPYTVTHASIWTAATGGTCLMKGALPIPRTISNAAPLTFEIGEIIAAMD